MQPPRISGPPTARNRETERKHRRESLWQIYIPFAAITLALLVSMVLIVIGAFGGGRGTASVWADALFIWMALPVIFSLLVPLALLIGLVVGVVALIKYLPPYTKIAQDYAELASLKAREYSAIVAERVMAVEGQVRAADTAVKGARKTVTSLTETRSANKSE